MKNPPHVANSSTSRSDGGRTTNACRRRRRARWAKCGGFVIAGGSRHFTRRAARWSALPVPPHVRVRLTAPRCDPIAVRVLTPPTTPLLPARLVPRGRRGRLHAFLPAFAPCVSLPASLRFSLGGPHPEDSTRRPARKSRFSASFLGAPPDGRRPPTKSWLNLPTSRPPRQSSGAGSLRDLSLVRRAGPAVGREKRKEARMAETPAGPAGRKASRGASPRPRVWYPLHRCPECGSYCRIVRRPTGEVYLACIDRIECGYQEALE